MRVNRFKEAGQDLAHVLKLDDQEQLLREKINHPNSEERRTHVLSMMLLLAGVLNVLAFVANQPSGEYWTGPGPIFSVHEAMNFDTEEGELFYTAVSSGEMTRWQRLKNIIIPAEPGERTDRPGRSGNREEQQQRALEQMETAKQTAVHVASIVVSDQGFEFEVDIEVVEVLEGSAAERSGIEAGDIILQVEQQELRNARELRDYIVGSNGSAVELTLQREGREETVQVTPELTEEETPRIGVLLVDTPVYSNMPEIGIDTRNVGGPSAGMMFTLGLIDFLGEGSLTGNNRVAGTGSITVHGDVNPVGGVQWKIHAAIENNIDVFFIPAANAIELEDYLVEVKDQIEIVVVLNIFDPLVWLCDNGATDKVCSNSMLAEYREETQ